MSKMLTTVSMTLLRPAISSSRFSSTFIRLIEQYTHISRDHLTPEIQLRLITRQSIAWTEKVEIESPHPLGEPYWAFYWPGGQGLARYILDYPRVVAGKKVLDFGSGSGCCSIAALLSGAATVVANDIDPIAVAASQINASINGVKLEVCRDDLIGSLCDPFDVILVGDMLYDSELANSINIWLIQLRKRGKRILVGDPGRVASNSLTCDKPYCWYRLAKYELDETTKQDNYGFNHTFVMTLL